MVAAGEQLSEVLGDGNSGPWPVHLAFSRFDAVRSIAPGVLLIASPLKDISPLERPFMDVEAFWRRWIDPVAASGSTLLLAMLFRAVPPGEDPRVIERIRRLNLLMVDLSKFTPPTSSISTAASRFSAPSCWPPITDFAARWRPKPQDIRSSPRCSPRAWDRRSPAVSRRQRLVAMAACPSFGPRSNIVSSAAEEKSGDLPTSHPRHLRGYPGGSRP